MTLEAILHRGTTFSILGALIALFEEDANPVSTLVLTVSLILSSNLGVVTEGVLGLLDTVYCFHLSCTRFHNEYHNFAVVLAFIHYFTFLALTSYEKLYCFSINGSPKINKR